METGDLDDLRRALDDARRVVTALEQRDTRRVERSRFLRDRSLRDAVETIGAHRGPVTLIVGAGASMEADLPSWRKLARNVLAASRPRMAPELRERWVAAVLAEGVVSAAAVAQALAPSQRAFRDLVVAQLYGGRRSHDFAPGAISKQVAWWKHRFGDDVAIATFNYDDLLERALAPYGAVRAAVDAEPERPGEAVVRHLHGRLSDAHQDDDFVLSDDDYARFPLLRERWQDRVMRAALEHSLCVFVGLSFTDPNLTRWIHRSAVTSGPPRIALFSRQSSPRLTPEVRRELEATTARRWAAAKVDVAFTDFYGELGQVLHEAAMLRAGDDCGSFTSRARALHGAASALLAPTGTHRFPSAQLAAARWLRELMENVAAIIRSNRVRFRNEQLGVGLWLADHPRGELTLTASSDRAMADRRSLRPVPMELVSQWAAVEAVTRGVAVDQHPDVYASRWRYVRALPLVVDEGRIGRLVAGAATLTSTRPFPDSVFGRLRLDARATIDEFVTEELVRVFSPA